MRIEDEPAPVVVDSHPGWPRWLRRGPLEMAAALVIALGIAMMLQPVAMALYTWSFVTTLFGTVLFMVVSKFPE